MSPLAELTPKSETHIIPMNKPIDVILPSGETVQAVSTPTGGFLRKISTEKPLEPDIIFVPGQSVRLGNGSLLIASSLETGETKSNPQIDGAV
jgi:hypothetical protein